MLAKKKKKSSKTLKGLYIASMFGLSHICKAIFTLKKKSNVILHINGTKEKTNMIVSGYPEK